MIPTDVLLAFFAASLALALAPGPDNLFVLAQSAQHGRRAGFAITLGLCTGLLVHTAAVIIGLAALFQTSAFAFRAVQFTGALYLAYLAWQSLRASAHALARAQTINPGLATFYRRGIFMNITNPKVSLFFLAFLPQFADSSRGAPMPQLLLLAGVFIATTLLVFGTIALLAGTLGQWLEQRPHAQRTVNASAGLVFLALALKLLFSEQ